MTNWVEGFLVVLMLTNLWLLGSSRLLSCIAAVSVQGVLLGLLPLVIGVVVLIVSLFIGLRLPIHGGAAPLLLVPAALFTALTGLFIIVGRRSAIVQALGYLAMESGIAAFGLALAEQEPLLIEMGTFLDAFVAVFVMGITIFHISREFDHIDADRLSSLKDSPE